MRFTRFLLNFGVHAAVIMLLALLFAIAFSFEEILDVMQSGMCPAAPTDIPPYRCTTGEYVMTRVWFNPWTLPFNLVLFLTISALYPGLMYLIRKLKAMKRFQ